MARIFQEGFESKHILNGQLTYEVNGIKKDVNVTGDLNRVYTTTGRNSTSLGALHLQPDTNSTQTYSFKFDTKTEAYYRMYTNNSAIGNFALYPKIFFYNGTDIIMYFRNSSINSGVSIEYDFFVLIGGTLTNVGQITLLASNWHRMEVYFKADATTGAYEVKMDGVSILSDTGLNTGTSGINSIKFYQEDDDAATVKYDDIAINDTTGSVNNSWCGAGTIVALKPNGAGNYSQFDESKGFVVGESGTTTTNIKVSGHGRSTGDWVMNISQGYELRKITVVDVDNFTVSSVTSQSDGDVFILYGYSETKLAGAGSNDALTVLEGVDINVYDFIENTTRNTYGVISADLGSTAYYVNYAKYRVNETFGTNIAGDTIKIFKPIRLAIPNHYEAVNGDITNVGHSVIATDTLNDIDSFDMEELVADKSIAAGSVINAVRHITVARDLGEGNQIKPLVRISSTDYLGDTLKLTSAKTQIHDYIYNVSPATSVQWTRAEIDALESGIKKV